MPHQTQRCQIKTAAQMQQLQREKDLAVEWSNKDMEPRGQKMESVVSTSTCCTGIERGEMICVAGVAATIESLTKHGVGPPGPCSPAFNTAMEKVVLQLLGVWFGLSNAMQCNAGTTITVTTILFLFICLPLFSLRSAYAQQRPSGFIKLAKCCLKNRACLSATTVVSIF